jgi:glycosyltransferase involved in cell wall biosynthesis
VRVPIQITSAGKIVPPRDAYALAEALIDVLESPADYQGQMERIVLPSTPEAVADEYEAIFTSLLERKTRKVHKKGTHSEITEYR